MLMDSTLRPEISRYAGQIWTSRNIFANDLTILHVANLNKYGAGSNPVRDSGKPLS